MHRQKGLLWETINIKGYKVDESRMPSHPYHHPIHSKEEIEKERKTIEANEESSEKKSQQEIK